jgi:uncharacterized protein
MPLGATRAFELFAQSAPRSRDLHLVASGGEHQLFLAEKSRLFAIDAAVAAQADAALASDDPEAVQRLLAEWGLSSAAAIDDDPPRDFRVRALSLAVAQKCNLGCSYCYARGGEFGGAAKNMPVETALRAVDLLLTETAPGERANLAFLGGEPLVNRDVLHAATCYAASRARARDIELTFSITTNGTLVTVPDIDLFEQYEFAVTVSLDGTRAEHDRLRPFKGGRGSFDWIMRNVAPMLERQRRMQVSARITVTPRNLALRETLDAFAGLGFHSIGFSPLLNAPDGGDEMQHDDLAVMLEQMIDCGYEFERRMAAHERYPFANLVHALREIRNGTHRPYPCGAGAGYFGVSADGDLSACHRFVGDALGAMGHIADGVDRDAQARWLTDRHVHRQQPCNRCWARYLCGGGCHHEVIHRGRPACDFIRGWLHYCLAAYGRLSRRRPDLFGPDSISAPNRG